jgi:hypothetical protein
MKGHPSRIDCSYQGTKRPLAWAYRVREVTEIEDRIHLGVNEVFHGRLETVSDIELADIDPVSGLRAMEVAKVCVCKDA